LNTLKRVAVGLAVAGLAYGLFLRTPLYRRGNPIFYRDGKPTGLGRTINGVWARVFGTGLLPSFLATIETVGRRSGRAYSAPVVIAEKDGEQYLVSMLGENSSWVRNARAAGGRAAIRHGSRREVILEEVPVAERAPLLRAYLSRASGARPHFPIAHDAPLAEFENIAGGYPVFRIHPATEQSRTAVAM
jgi:deazaflavin-dependent oxidoreductase (nitroreductase family)